MGRLIQIKDMTRNIDDRGSFTEIMRSDWSELFGNDGVEQANYSISFPGIVRAWHRHVRGQSDTFVVLKGSLKICAYNDVEEDGKGELEEVVLSWDRLQAARVIGKYWHGTKCVSSSPSQALYFVTRLYNPSKPDELRRAWNDPAIVPSKINGNSKDPRVGKFWDWNYIPFK